MDRTSRRARQAEVRYLKRLHRRRGSTVIMFRGQHGLCYLCGGRMTLETGYPNTATVEHVTPRCRLPDVEAERAQNRRLACDRCNARKGNMTPEEYREAKFVRKWRGRPS